MIMSLDVTLACERVTTTCSGGVQIPPLMLFVITFYIEDHKTDDNRTNEQEGAEK